VGTLVDGRITLLAVLLLVPYAFSQKAPFAQELKQQNEVSLLCSQGALQWLEGID
jgi:hypothetical protein